jgi:hypothetical protein
MLNKEIYTKNPSERKLANNGVANVNDNFDLAAQEVLKYELETFVCDGQYEKGLEYILQNYLDNILQPEQQAVWVSGFYGSGKSHLVKMLRVLWNNQTFSDGSTARSIADLPSSVSDLLTELSYQAKKHGGVHAASGTLGSGKEGSVRMALLGVIFKSAGLFESYQIAQFQMYLKRQGVYDKVKNYVESNNGDWEEELHNLILSDPIREVLCTEFPSRFNQDNYSNIIIERFREVDDVTNDEMITAIKNALSVDGKFPLTLVVLDEVQQYIGEDASKSFKLQETVETCCKKLGGKLLFVGTGQTAVTGTPNLKKLEGRYTVRIELSDTDVDAVIRKVILAKKPTAMDKIKETMTRNLGEISRHLHKTTLEHSKDDIDYFVADYPILPVRRRFWDSALKALDQTGTDSQLRNQLSMIHKVIQSNTDLEVGNVIPGDELYFDNAVKMQQAHTLPRKIYEYTTKYSKGTPDEQLTARAVGLIFLINKLAHRNKEIGIRPDVETIADLLITDLNAGSAELRSKLPNLLDACPLTMKVDNEYRIHTDESANWMDEYQSNEANLNSKSAQVEAERQDRIKKYFIKEVNQLRVMYGKTKVPFTIHPTFDGQLPSDADDKITLWVRDQWSVEENSVKVDAVGAGNESPVLYLFIPKRNGDDLRKQIITYKSAHLTLEVKGMPKTPEGMEARASMETIKNTAEGKIENLLNECFSGTKLFQAGGNEIFGTNLQQAVSEGAENSAARLYPKFNEADEKGWDKVYDAAKKGFTDALKYVGYSGEIQQHPICNSIIKYIQAGKKGIDIRNQFSGKGYGWSQDAIDGALQVLLVGNILKATNREGKPVDPRALERKNIPQTQYKTESVTITAPQRIKIKQLLQKLNVKAKSNEEWKVVPLFCQELRKLQNNAGGVAPKPQVPYAPLIEDLESNIGNEVLQLLLNNKDEIEQWISEWQDAGKKIADKLPRWETLKRFLPFAMSLSSYEEIKPQVDNIEANRRLLSEPDLIQPIVAQLEKELREAINTKQLEFKTNFEALNTLLLEQETWQKLAIDEQERILKVVQIYAIPHQELGTENQVMESLANYSLDKWDDQAAALKGRFDRALELAVKETEPKSRTFAVPKGFLKDEADLQEWLKATEDRLRKALKDGPIHLQ